MRRGVEDGSRACLEVGPRLVEAGAATLTLHPRSAKQMYTGYADHSLTAELVELVDVPVIASGDVTSHAKAQAVLDGDGRGRGDGRPRRAGQPVGDPRDRLRRRRAAVARGGRRRADRLHPRDRARARRAARVGLPEEVLRLVPRARALPAPVQAGARAAALDRRGRDCACSPRRRAPPSFVERLEAELPDPDDDVLLDSCRSRVYGGG